MTMRQLFKLFTILVLSVSLLGMEKGSAAADDFYTTRLRSGQDALRAKRSAEAVDQLRIAAFGLMEQPELLMEALACLTLAQAQVGREGVDATLQRMVEVERQIPSYAKAVLDPAFKAEFEALAKKRLTPETAALVPALVGAAPRVAAAAPTATPVPAAPTPAPTAAPAAAPGPAELTATARRLIGENKPAEARRLLVAALPRHGKNRELRKALLEAACLSKDWKVAVEQIPNVEPFADGEEPLVFYAAVARFETGDLESARTLLGGVRARLASSSYVDYYVRRILGG